MAATDDSGGTRGPSRRAQLSTCTCGAQVLWVTTEKGAKLCLEPEPTEDGRVIIRCGPELGVEVAHVETKAEIQERLASTIAAARLAYVPHWASCPDAKRHRRR